MKPIAFVGDALDALREFPVSARREAGAMTSEPLQTFASVWDALEETPDEAAHMRLRYELAIAVRWTVEGWRVTQAQAASRLGVTLPRLNDLLRGRVGKFSLDALIGLAERAGLVVRMEISQAAA